MKYTIYELIQPSHLKEVENEGYYINTIHRDVLQKLDVHDIESEHDTMESAANEIRKHSDKLKHKTLTVLPIFTIDWEGMER